MTRDIRSGLTVALGLLGACGTRPPATFVQADTGFYQEVSWRPDGTALAVSVLDPAPGDPGFTYRVFEVGLDNPQPRQVTPGPMDYWTAWSPDGSQLAFNGGRGPAADIFLVRTDGTGRRRLTTDSAQDIQPDWSPDGKHIAFVSNRGGSEQVWVMNADGGEPRRLVEGEGQAQNPRWSPDGTRIAYYETDGAGHDFLTLVNADGTGRRRLGPGVWPSWTPAGDSLVFSGPEGLYIASADGSGGRLLRAGDIVSGEISPDGSRLAFIEKVNGDITLTVAAIDGSGRRLLLRRPAPKWE